jgi:acyl carrier protein
MGLDAVEIILRAEEFYSITIADDEAGRVRTVGDFYELICNKLNVAPLPNPKKPAVLPRISEIERSFVILRKHTHLPPPPEVLPWTPQSIWDTVVAIFVDQQGLKPDRVLYSASLANDLGID